MMENYLFKSQYHNKKISGSTFLVTGGCGFIGSNIVEYLLRFDAGHVRVLDNLSNGYRDNIKDFLSYPNFEFIEGDIRDLQTCRNALQGVDYVSHQAALGSVPRSIGDPVTSNAVNVDGFLNMLVAAKEVATLKKFVYAASSSTYGDSKDLPKVEGKEGKPLSPYAVTKLVNELYADVFSKCYSFHTIGLRYFNVFGPRQNPTNPYAAVIPLFMKCALDKRPPVIYGDGLTSRDFTFVGNAVQANIKALLDTDHIQQHEVYNIAVGGKTTLLDLWQIISGLGNCSGLKPAFKEERPGDVRASLANITKAAKGFGYSPQFNSEEGLAITYKWYEQNLASL
jgi:UDP-N-acetylglucosamine 4-epimerase